MSTKEDYIRKMHSKLDQWNAEIDALAAKADQATAETRAEYHKEIEALRSKRDQAKSKTNELQQSTESAWEDMKQGVESAWDAVGEAVNSAKSHFK